MTDFRLVTFRDSRGLRAGVMAGNFLFDAEVLTGRPDYATVLGILEDWPAAEVLLREALRGETPAPIDRATVEIVAPIPKPAVLYCAGANFKDHTERMFAKQNLPPPPDPHSIGLNSWHFLKAGHTVIGSGGEVQLNSAALDWEAELAVVIGRKARNVSEGEALDYVAGYTIANDLSARDRARRAKVEPSSPFAYDWVGHKNFDGSCPLGPAIVPASQVRDPQDLAIRLWVNGEIRQDSSTANMIFSVAEQIAHLSSVVTLHPGDVILTGTPAGTGAETDEFLRSGDEIRVSIADFGDLETRIV